MARWHPGLKKLLPEINIKILFGGNQRTEMSKGYFWHGPADFLRICFYLPLFFFFFFRKTDEAGCEMLTLSVFYLLNIQVHC